MNDPSETIHSDDLADLAKVVTPRLQKPSRAKRDAVGGKTGRFALSETAIAWICSISIHAIVFGTGVWIVTTLVHHAQLPSEWGGGGGNSGGGVEGQPPSQIADGLPAAAMSAPTEISTLPVQGEVKTDPVFSTELRPSIDFAAERDVASIGASATSDTGKPNFTSHRPQTGSSGGSNGKTNQRPSASTVGNIADSGPGLPGALMGSGPPAPDYPEESKRLGEQGTVRVAIEVLPDGSVGQIQVVSDSGFARLRDASLNAAKKLRQYKLNPAIRGGTPIREVIVIPYRFSLR